MKKHTFPIAVFWLIVQSLFASVDATVIQVPEEFPAIQDAIDAASAGDTVLVAEGTFTGPGFRDIRFHGKNLVVRSINGPVNTILEVVILRAFTFDGGESRESVVDGFTIRGGRALGDFGGAICCRNGSSPTIRNCIIRENEAVGQMLGCGGGIASLENSSPLIEDCLLLENDAYGDTFGWGGGLVIREASATLIDCVIAGNYAVSGGGVLVYHGQATFIGCTISGNSSECGGGVDLTHGSAETTFRECTIAGNRAWFQGGGITGESVRLERTVVWGNCCSPDHPEMDQIRASGDLEFVCCALDSAGIFTTGEISYSDCAFSDPLFCAPIPCEEAPTAEGDYRLDAASPCVPINSPCGDWIGALKVGCPLSDVPKHVLVLNRSDMEILPNPTTGDCRIQFYLPTASSAHIDLLDAEGRVIRALWKGMAVGEHQVTWDGRGADGRLLPVGIYWSRLSTGETQSQRSILIVR